MMWWWWLPLQELHCPAFSGLGKNDRMAKTWIRSIT
jgi:hypothetical protein